MKAFKEKLALCWVLRENLTKFWLSWWFRINLNTEVTVRRTTDDFHEKMGLFEIFEIFLSRPSHKPFFIALLLINFIKSAHKVFAAPWAPRNPLFRRPKAPFKKILANFCKKSITQNVVLSRILGKKIAAGGVLFLFCIFVVLLSFYKVFLQ